LDRKDFEMERSIRGQNDNGEATCAPPRAPCVIARVLCCALPAHAPAVRAHQPPLVCGVPTCATALAVLIHAHITHADTTPRHALLADVKAHVLIATGAPPDVVFVDTHLQPPHRTRPVATRCVCGVPGKTGGAGGHTNSR
jgi:hypothetical protein